MHSASSFSSSTRPLTSGAQNTQPASRLPSLGGVAAEAEGLQVAEVVRAARFLGTMWSTSRALWCGVCHATAGAAAFAPAFGPGEHPVFDRAADRGAVAAAVGEHLLAALLSESIEALAAQFQQLFALDVAQLLPAHQVVSTSLVAGDAVAGENLAHHPLDALW
jgi:hypothetical protein